MRDVSFTSGDGFGLASRAVALPPSKWQTAFETLSRAQNHGLQPNRFLASACAKHNFWSRSLLLLSWLQAAQGRPDAHFCTTIEASCARSSKWAASMHILEKLCHLALCPTVAALNAAAQAACKTTGYWQGALQRLRLAQGAKMDASGLQLDAISLVLKITALTSATKWPSCLQSLVASECRILRPQASIARNAAGNCCVQSSAWTFPLQVLNGSVLSVDPIGSNTILRARGKSMDWQAASAVFRGMQQRRSSVSRITQNTLLDALADVEQWRESLRALRLPVLRLSPDAVAVAAAMAACERARAWQCSFALMSDKRSRSLSLPCQPHSAHGPDGLDVVLTNCAISATVRALCWQGALSLFSSLLCADAVEQASLGTCLTAAASAREWPMALGLLGYVSAYSLELDLLALSPAILSVGSRWRLSLCLAGSAAGVTLAAFTPAVESASRVTAPCLPVLLEDLATRLHGFFCEHGRTPEKKGAWAQ